MWIRITIASFAGVLAATSIVATAASAPIDDKKASQIMSKAGCAMCHAVDKKMVGPSYKEVAGKRKGEKDAAAIVVKKIREGGKGTYGVIPMPPHPATKIGDEDLKALVDWVLTK